jgi:hypothetical protein
MGRSYRKKKKFKTVEPIIQKREIEEDRGCGLQICLEGWPLRPKCTRKRYCLSKKKKTIMFPFDLQKLIVSGASTGNEIYKKPM